MPEPHSVMVVASVAAASSLVSVAAAAYLLPLWQNKGSEHSYNASNRRLPTAQTPEPSSSSAVQPGALFSPVNKQKRPDPYDPNPRSTYLSWDDYFMALAFLSAERSKDPNKQVGACIVNDNNIILSIGYNGFPRGCADRALPWSKRAASGSILDTKYPYVVHAEANALLNKNQAHVTGARIYVTLFPCNECAKLLIQAGIKEVIFHEAKLEPTGQRPATMERAAAADAAVDRLEEAVAAAAAAAATAAAQAAAGLPRTGSGDTSGSNSTSDAANACISCECQASGQAAGSSVGGEQAGPSHHRQQQQQQRPEKEQGGTGKKKFGVGSGDDVDASYAASQRLLMLAGVKLRQHRLQRSIQLGPG